MMEYGTTVNQNVSMFHDNDIVAGIYVERQTFIMMMELLLLLDTWENKGMLLERRNCALSEADSHKSTSSFHY